MPIARINKDGTVKIYNSNTGETKDVKPEELGRYNPKMVGEYYSMVGEGPTADPVKELQKVKAEKELTAIKSGKAPEMAAELSDSERKNQKLAKAGLRALKTVKEIYEKDPNVLTKQLTPGKFESRTFDSALFNAVNALLRIQTGATAPEEEVRRYMGSLGPNFGDKPEDVGFKINQLGVDLTDQGYLTSDEAGELFPIKREELPQQSIVQTQQPGIAVQAAQQRAFQSQQPSNLLDQILNPVAQGPVGAGAEALLSLIAPNVKNVAQQSGRGQEVSADQLVGAGGDLLSTIIPFAKVGKLGLAAKGALAGATKGLTTPDQTPGERIQSGATDALFGGALGKLVQVPGAIKNKFGIKEIGARRDAAIEAGKNIKISGDKIAAAAKEYVKDDPLAAGVLKKILPTIEKKQLSVPELMRKIDVWNDAYTQAGRVGKSAEAGLNNVLARKAKDLVGKQAPDITKANKAFSRTYGAGDLLKKTIPMLGLGAGGKGVEMLWNSIFGGK